MNASALITQENTNERLMLGKVSAGPLGDHEHEHILAEILAANRKKNPVKVAKDRTLLFFKLIFHTFNLCNPSRISPEMRAEKTRPIPGEIASALCCLIVAGLISLVWLYSTIKSVTLANNWEGPVDCLVVDKILRDSISYETKMVIKLKDVTNYTVAETMPSIFEGFGDEAFQCNLDLGTKAVDKEVRKKKEEEGRRRNDKIHNPDDSRSKLKCEFANVITHTHTHTHTHAKQLGSGKKVAGPCCHTPFQVNKQMVNETFQCYYSFDTSYCNNDLSSFETDDDFRGIGQVRQNIYQIDID